MIPVRGYAAQNATSSLAPFEFERRDLRPNDVLIDILYCGVCHSDIHQARNEWGNSMFPMVPGHEIIGKVSKVGPAVTKIAVGDIAGIGCFVDSCRSCRSCKAGEEQYCEGHLSVTYNGTEQDQKTPTYGGYSSMITADEQYVLKVPPHLDLMAAAPLLCAGITTYSPLRHWGVGKGHKVAILGLGGLGHMAVKFAASFGAEVTVISTSPKKKEDALRLGAHNFINSSEEGALGKATGVFDYIVDTIAAPHDINSALNLLVRDGTLIMVGAPSEPLALAPFPLIMRRRKIGGSLIGGIKETQEMLNYCGQHNIVCDVEKISMNQINEAYERMIKGDVRYRFVIDCKTI